MFVMQSAVLVVRLPRWPLMLGSPCDRANARVPKPHPVSDTTGQAAAEAELMRHIGDGDGKAFRQLVDAHGDSVLNFCQRMLGSRAEAEDATQETFLRAWNHASTWTPRAKLVTWLYRIAQNLCVDRLRRRREKLDDEADAPTSMRPSLLLQRKRVAEAVTAALDELAPRQRVAVTLVHFQGLSNAEAAAAMDVEVDALESLLARGRRKLRQSLKTLAPDMGDEDAGDG